MLKIWWDGFAAFLGTSPVGAASLTAGGALLAGLVSALVSYLVARRGVYINAVTIERSKWIEALRGTVSKLSGAAFRMLARRDDAKYAGSADFAADSQTLRTLLTELTLRLNPREDEAVNLLRAAGKLDQAARLHSSAAVFLANAVMVRHAQWAAKAEWERVKQEASGWPRMLAFLWKGWRRRAAYKKATVGDAARLDAIGSGLSDHDLETLRNAMDEPSKPSTTALPQSTG